MNIINILTPIAINDLLTEFKYLDKFRNEEILENEKKSFLDFYKKFFNYYHKNQNNSWIENFGSISLGQSCLKIHDNKNQILVDIKLIDNNIFVKTLPFQNKDEYSVLLLASIEIYCNIRDNFKKIYGLTINDFIFNINSSSTDGLLLNLKYLLDLKIKNEFKHNILTFRDKINLFFDYLQKELYNYLQVERDKIEQNKVDKIVAYIEKKSSIQYQKEGFEEIQKIFQKRLFEEYLLSQEYLGSKLFNINKPLEEVDKELEENKITETKEKWLGWKVVMGLFIFISITVISILKYNNII